jgi:hypothetical protein
VTALSKLSLVSMIAVAGCSKSGSDNNNSSNNNNKAGSAAPPAAIDAGGVGSGSGSAEAPVEAAAVVGPTKSAKGALAVSGKLTGSFEWKKKDQKSPISCAWDPEKEIGGTRVDLSDGAGHLLTVAVDVPPSELGPARLDVMSVDLPGPQNTHKGFKVSGDEEGNIKVVFDNAVFPEPADPPAKGKKADKAAPPPADTVLTIKGTLEVSCPAKK